MKLEALTRPSRFTGPEGQEDMPWLLTPGPLTTSRNVKLAMLADWGSRDVEFRALVAEIRDRLKSIANAGDDYECVIMQGAGTFAIEAVLGAFAPKGRKRKTLVITNGAYGERAAGILERIGSRPFVVLQKDDDEAPTARQVAAALKKDETISTVFVVHCETTSGIVNPLEEIAAVVNKAGCRLIVDAMSSFGALPLDMEASAIDVMVSSANKCIEGVPGFSYAICRRDMLIDSEGKSHSLALDLFDQWRAMEKNGQFRFTPPTHALAAFREALSEHRREGGVEGRRKRYEENRQRLLKAMRRLGFETLLDDAVSGPIIQTFLTPADPNFDFEAFYDGLRQRGYAIYPGKLTRRSSFRIGTIGRIDATVIDGLAAAIGEVLSEMGVTNLKPE